MPAQYVKPYIKGNKHDANDAAGICEAVTRPSMRFVSINTLEQQDLQNLLRSRTRRVAARVALINQIRGLLGEYGISSSGKDLRRSRAACRTYSKTPTTH